MALEIHCMSCQAKTLQLGTYVRDALAFLQFSNLIGN